MLENVLELIKENPEAVASLNDFISTNGDNVARVGTLESELSDAIARRKSLHGIVSKATGLTDLTEEALNGFAQNADAGLKADNETLQGRMLELQTSLDTLGATHENEISEMVLKDTLRGLGVADRVANDMALKQLTSLVLEGAVRDGSSFTFKDGDKTIFGASGKPITVEERVIQLSEGEFSFLFNPVKGGGGGDTKTPLNTKTQTKLQSDVSNTLASMGKI